GPPDAGKPGRLAAAWRRLRVPLAFAAFVALGVTLIVLLAPVPKSNVYLDPTSSQPDGAKALADILGSRGYQVIDAYSATSALASLRSAGTGATLLVTSPGLLTRAERAQLAGRRG